MTASASANAPRRVDIAADQQQPAHVGFAAQAGEQFLQRASTGKPPRRDMGDRLKAGFAQGSRRRRPIRAASCVGTAVR